MSHLLDRLNFLQPKELETFADGHGQVTRESRDWEDVYRNRWRHDKIVRSTHGVNCTGLVLVEDLRQVRDRHLGDAADRLSAHAARPAEPRAARLRPRRELQLVPLQRQPGEDAAGARPADEDLAPAARDDDADKGVGGDPAGPGAAGRLCDPPRQGRPRARALGRGDRDHRGRERLHGQDLRPRPRLRLLADPGDVDGQLRRRLALSQPARRHLHVVLRLVLRPAAGLADDLGRADRRAGIGRLVQCRAS